MIIRLDSLDGDAEV